MGGGSGCSGGTTYTYDNRGNLTSDGSRSFSYDLANQMVSGPSTTVAYDPLGRLQEVTASSSTTQYLYDGAMLVAEYNTSGTVLRRYVPGQGVDETLVWYEGSGLSTPHWLHSDQQGSVVAATNSSGTATPYAYSATGEPKGGWSSSAPAFRYTGQVAIASAAVYYYKARMYDPALGRFLQTDPTGYQAGMNLYAYVGNDPTNKTDPSGNIGEATAIGCAVTVEVGCAPGAIVGAVVDTAIALGALGTVGCALSPTCQKAIQDFVNRTDRAPEANPQILESRGKNRLPPTGIPGDIATNGPGTQQRKYGPDGQPLQDWNKGHPGAKPPEDQDHVHDHIPNPQNPTGRPTRQPGRAPDQPGDLTGPKSSSFQQDQSLLRQMQQCTGNRALMCSN